MDHKELNFSELQAVAGGAAGKHLRLYHGRKDLGKLCTHAVLPRQRGRVDQSGGPVGLRHAGDARRGHVRAAADHHVSTDPQGLSRQIRQLLTKRTARNL